MNDTRNPMEVFREEAPAAAQAFNGLITALSASQDLDGRTRQLIYIAMKAAQGDVGAVAAHAGMAKKAGASRAEAQGSYPDDSHSFRNPGRCDVPGSGALGVGSCVGGYDDENMHCVRDAHEQA